MPRGHYSAISDVDRDRLITCFENNRDWITLAQELGVKRQSARNIICTFRRTGRRQQLRKGGNRPQSLDQNKINRIIGYIEAQPTITLNEIKQRLAREFPDWNPCSTQTISNTIDGQLITLKLLRTIPNEWNIQRVKKFTEI